jgi:hypothetical protein
MFVPQGFAGVDFRSACQRHDDCYAAGCDRKMCDDRFLNDMLGACQCSPLPCLCRLRAWQWYIQVRLAGGFGYNSSGGNRCGCQGCCSSGCGTCGTCSSGAPEYEVQP